MEPEIFVYVDLGGAPVPAGRLRTRARRGRETASFEYDTDWLANAERFALEPSMTLAPGPVHTEKALFGAIGDSAPDRWGRILMRRAEHRRAAGEGETPRTLLEADYLLSVDDEARQGALRFKEDPEGPFLAEGGGGRIPPLVELPRLLSAAERTANDEDSDEDIRLLLRPGSSLGGARPKASVRDRDGALALAKFPRPQDENDVVLWEGVALALAQKAGVETAEWRIENIAGKRVIVIQRFDRRENLRIPFLSAMSMLGASDNEDGHSYLEIADTLDLHGAAAKADKAQLWRRIVFSVLISNTDDHLRNHGFLYEGHKGWRLSPAYDINPEPGAGPRVLSTAVDMDNPTASIGLALETADYYGLNLKDAKNIAHEAARAASGWRREAERLGAPPREIERMASAFEHEESRKALAFA